jgi:chemotaxis response regulator CheB
MLPVLATDVASSEWFAMPSATIARGAAIDHVVALDELAALLMEIIAARAME